MKNSEIKNLAERALWKLTYEAGIDFECACGVGRAMAALVEKFNLVPAGVNSHKFAAMVNGLLR